MQRAGALPVHASVVVALAPAGSAPLYSYDHSPAEGDRQRDLLLPTRHVARWAQFYYDYMHIDTQPPLYSQEGVVRYILGIDVAVQPQDQGIETELMGEPRHTPLPGNGYGLVDAAGVQVRTAYCVGVDRLMTPVYYGGPLVVVSAREMAGQFQDASYRQIAAPLA